MRGLFLDNLTSLVGDVFRGVTNSTSRMKESVLFHKEEEEKKHKQMEERNKKEVAQLRGELEERNKQIKANEEELKTREKRAKEDEAKHKQEVAQLQEELEGRAKKLKANEEKNRKEVAQLKGEVEERSRKIKEDEANHKQEVANLQKSFHIRIGQFEKRAKEDEAKHKQEVAQLQKKLEDKDGVIGELKKHNAGLRVAFDLNAGVNMQMEDLDGKIEEANLEVINLKRSRQELEETAGPEMKKVCAAVIQLRSNDVANGLKVIDASAKIIAPAVAMSKNAKRRAQRAKNGGDDGLKGNKYLWHLQGYFHIRFISGRAHLKCLFLIDL